MSHEIEKKKKMYWLFFSSLVDFFIHKPYTYAVQTFIFYFFCQKTEHFRNILLPFFGGWSFSLDLRCKQRTKVIISLLPSMDSCFFDEALGRVRYCYNYWKFFFLAKPQLFFQIHKIKLLNLDALQVLPSLVFIVCVKWRIVFHLFISWLCWSGAMDLSSSWVSEELCYFSKFY